MCAAEGLNDVIFVGHSVSGMIGVLAAIREPERFARLVLIGSSPRYVNGDGYIGGFDRTEIDGFLEFPDSNQVGWSTTMAPVLMGNQDRVRYAGAGTELAARYRSRLVD